MDVYEPTVYITPIRIALASALKGATIHYLDMKNAFLHGHLIMRLKSMRMKLSWIDNYLSDCLFQIARLAQTTEDMLSKNPAVHIKILNKEIKYATDNILTLKLLKLFMKSLQIFRVFLFANNHGISSKL